MWKPDTERLGCSREASQPKKRGQLSAEDQAESPLGRRAERNVMTARRKSRRDVPTRSRFYRRARFYAAAGVVVLCSTGLWLSFRVMEVRDHLSAVASLVPEIKLEVTAGNDLESRKLLGKIQEHAGAALQTTNDPVWNALAVLPILGQNFDAIQEIAGIVDSAATDAAEPLLDASSLLAPVRSTPVDGKIDINVLQGASPHLDAAASSLDNVVQRLGSIERRYLAPEIAVRLDELAPQLEKAARDVNLASDISRVLPAFLGADEPRNYLILVQNSAEVRATGGLPGSLAVIRFENGQVDLSAQASGVQLGKFVPPVPVDEEQEKIYTSRLGAYISDVNLTPDFPTAAQTAKKMWEARYSTNIDGVFAIDPVVLAHVLATSGPLPLSGTEDMEAATDFPVALTAENVVPTLLSDVYDTFDGQTQDVFFAYIAERFFDALVAGETPPTKVLQALSKSVDENRIHAWSARESEQNMISSAGLGGAMTSGPDAGPASFGVFFNDGTGAKMDYYVKRQVQLTKECTRDTYHETTVRVTSTNTVDANAAANLSKYVTGGGVYGVSPGSVQTNIVVYGPAEAYVETARLDGKRIDFAPYRHGQRPVAVVAVILAPGESKTVEFSFGKLGQNPEPELRVTPTVQDVNDVVLPTKVATCPPGS